MSAKGFFGFFRGNSKTTFTEEEQQQRAYALEKEKEEKKSGSKAAKQKVSAPKVTVVEQEEREPGPGVSEELASFCLSKLKELLTAANLEGDVTISRNSDNTLILDISDSDDLGRTIGKSGATLDAFQTLVRAFAYRKFETPFRLSIDAGDYKKKKIQPSRKRQYRPKRAHATQDSQLS